MKPTILVVEDNPDVLFNIKLILEVNNYRVITATNGVKALEVLSQEKKRPDLILSDIMMPICDGYELYKRITENPDWILIPFLFLTALATPEDIRLGKLLGVDDYLTKPFTDEDLLAVIRGKLARSAKKESLREEFEKKLIKALNLTPSVTEQEKESISLLFLEWNEYSGPMMSKYHPPSDDDTEYFHQIGVQLFHASVSVFGQHAYGSADILLNVSNIGKYAYVLFDFVKDEEIRGGERLFMLAVLAPKINYLESITIKNILENLTENKIKKFFPWKIEAYWNDIVDTLTKSEIFQN